MLERIDEMFDEAPHRDRLVLRRRMNEARALLRLRNCWTEPFGKAPQALVGDPKKPLAAQFDMVTNRPSIYGLLNQRSANPFRGPANKA